MRNSPLPRRLAPGLKQCFLQNGVLCRQFQGLSNVGYTQLVLPSSLRDSALQHLHYELGHQDYGGCQATVLLAWVRKRCPEVDCSFQQLNTPQTTA